MEVWRHQSSQDPCLGKGRWSLGQSPMPDAPDQGAAQTRVSAALSQAPHRAPPPAQWPAAPNSSNPEEHEPHSVFSSGMSATSCRVRTLGRGSKEVVECWGPRVLAALPAQRLSSLLSEGLPPQPWEVASGSADAAWALSLWARGSRMGGATGEREIGASGCASGALGPQV